ncbi:alpha/beta hydrolase [Roseomonas sp. PWR1]|uniref:Alpha/beta hydrolase n=1 Tax=Roseomonas nitratireducens TaxID=2820810 RepID=A0ABS4AT23_9PROT|nr:alpha/beta hydrolase [Neoroseomonas nitratireducens]MBP0464508.1 alpha/beta hydrolase [Neoroseomonas nitratireducens]
MELSARDGLRLSALEWPGPAGRTPILCLSGICRTARDFTALAARHASRRRIVALDYAGHGDSARATDPRRYAPEALIRDVLDMMAALNLHRVALVGTSFGGLAAMAMGVMRPASLAAVALNDIGPVIEHVGREAVVDFIGRDPAFASLDEAVAWLRVHHPPLPLLDEAGWRDFAERGYEPGADGRLHPRWDIRVGQQAVGAAAGRPPDLWPFFGSLSRLPLMLVWGEESRLLSAATVAAMRHARPDMGVVALPGTGHAPTLGEPAAAAALDAFLEAVP